MRMIHPKKLQNLQKKRSKVRGFYGTFDVLLAGSKTAAEGREAPQASKAKETGAQGTQEATQARGEVQGGHRGGSGQHVHRAGQGDGGRVHLGFHGARAHHQPRHEPQRQRPGERERDRRLRREEPQPFFRQQQGPPVPRLIKWRS